MDSYTTARLLQTYHNCHLGESVPMVTDLSLFMPHPHQWLAQMTERKVHVDRVTAILFLRTYQDFGTDVVASFESWIRELEIIAAGG